MNEQSLSLYFFFYATNFHASWALNQKIVMVLLDDEKEKKKRKKKAPHSSEMTNQLLSTCCCGINWLWILWKQSWVFKTNMFPFSPSYQCTIIIILKLSNIIITVTITVSHTALQKLFSIIFITILLGCEPYTGSHLESTWPRPLMTIMTKTVSTTGHNHHWSSQQVLLHMHISQNNH